MSFYETLYIVDPNLENSSLEKTMDEIGKELEKTKSKIINHRVWGKKRLAYPIERQKYGSYILIQFESGDQEKMIDYDTKAIILFISFPSNSRILYIFEFDQ